MFNIVLYVMWVECACVSVSCFYIHRQQKLLLYKHSNTVMLITSFKGLMNTLLRELTFQRDFCFG